MKSRTYDEFVEKTVGNLTCDRYWSQCRGGYERVYDTDRQIKGIDYIVGKKKYKVDEKIKYRSSMNQVLDYPGLEITRLQRDGVRAEGWFVDETMETDIYSLVNIWTTDADEDEINGDKITRLHMTLIGKRELQGLVYGLTPREQIMHDALSLIDNNGYRHRYTNHNLFHLTFSKNLNEKPVNLVLHLEELRKLKAQGRFHNLKEKDIEICK